MKRVKGLLVLVAILVGSTPAFAFEQLVGPITAYYPEPPAFYMASSPDLAVDSSNQFMITWLYYGADMKMKAAVRLFDSQGNALTDATDIQVSSGNALSSAITVDQNNHYIVVWDDERNGGPETYIFGRRFDTTGLPLGPDFRVDQAPAGQTPLISTAVAADQNSNFIVAWTDTRMGPARIYGRRYDSSGNSLGDEFRIDQNGTARDSSYPAVTADRNNNFIVAWTDRRNNVFNPDIYCRRFDANGNALGADFRVDQSPGPAQSTAIASGPNNNFIVAWQDSRVTVEQIYARRYDGSGAPLGAEFRVDQYSDTIGTLGSPAIAIDQANVATIVWNDPRNSSVQTGVRARRYDAAGTALGDDFSPTPYLDVSARPRVASDHNNRVIFAWNDDDSVNSFIHFSIWGDDTDHDGVLDSLDNCPLAANPGQENSDADIFGNACDNCPLTTNQNQLDTDSDLIGNLCDNCPSVSNPGQENHDADAQGDACDFDDDNDGLEDTDETANGCDPFLPDTDGDGLTDADEILTIGSSCTSSDTDGDLLPDAWEYQYATCGFDPLSLPSEFNVAKLSPDLSESSIESSTSSPALAWTGSEYGMVWNYFDYYTWDFYFVRIAADGTRIGSEVQLLSEISDLENPPHPTSIVWTGSEFGVTMEFEDYSGGKIYFRRISAAGVPIGSNVSIVSSSSSAPNPSLTWTGSEYGLSWEWSPGEIYFTRISAAGAKIGADIRETNAVNSSATPSLVWTGSQYGVSWADYRYGNGEIFFARLSATGTKTGVDVRLTNAADYSTLPSLNWTGTEFGVSWQDRRNGKYEIYFTRVSATGAKIGSDIRITTTATDRMGPTMNWTGSMYALAWSDTVFLSNKIHFALLTPAGAQVGPESLVTSDTSFIYASSLAWTGSEFAVGWSGYCQATTGACFTRFNQAYTDKDSDGLRENQEYASGTNPCAADTDGDGLTDSYEVNTTHTNPVLADTDGDGLSDSEEVNTTLTNPLLPDTDNDGLPDGWEDQYSVCGFDPLSRGSELTDMGKIGDNLRVTNALGASSMPSLAWTGSEYGLSWSDARDGQAELYFARLSAAGQKIGADLRVTTSGHIGIPSMAWSGSEFGVSWDYNYGSAHELSFVRISSAGAPIGAVLPVSSGTLTKTQPSLTWTGSEFGLVWLDGRAHVTDLGIYFSRVSAAGAEIGDDLLVPETIPQGAMSFPSLKGTGGAYGVIWVAYYSPMSVNSLFFAKLSSAGAKIGTEVRLADWAYGRPSLAWTGSEFGASWSGGAGFDVEEVWFCRVDAWGAKIGADLRLTNTPSAVPPYNPWLAWNGSEFGVSWGEVCMFGGHCQDVFFSRISATGQPLMTKLQMSSAGGDSEYPSLVAAGPNYGISWQDTRDGDYEIYFARVGAFYTDKDHDGLPEDQEYALGTDPCSSDSDGDGLADGYEINTSLTDPLLFDTDGDGLGDGNEVNTLHTNPLFWDTDGDRLPDKFEADNAGHTGGALDPLNALDAPLDYDGDGNSNKHEYWNGSDPWYPDPVPGMFANPGCFYWGDGDGDGVPAPADVTMLKLEIAGIPQPYDYILPHTFETLDLDRDGVAAPADRTNLILMVAGIDLPGGLPSQAAALTVEYQPSTAVSVGTTTHVTVSVHSLSGPIPFSPGFGVVFTVSGNAILLGGDGAADGGAPGNRYDISMQPGSGSRANVVVLVTGSGPVTIGAQIPACGVYPSGRWNDEVLLSPEVIINGP